MNKSLGQLRRIEAREIWETEDQDFTPWLASETNLKILGETIGLELELEAQEKNVGPFRADILCKNTLDGSWVLIENQIEKTDHKHLGQLLTYAAGLDAVTVIWIASKFTEEHRSALDWLNRITDSAFQFFGLQIEVWRINESLPAPNFKVISQPNEWSSSVSKAAHSIEDELSDSQELQFRFWSGFSDYLDSNSSIKLRSPRAKGWSDFALGKTNAFLRSSIGTQANKISVSFCLYENMKKNFEFVQEQKDLIESKLGEKLIWENNSNKKTAIIKLEREAYIVNENDRPEQYSWLKNKLESFKEVFMPIVREL